MAGNPLGPDRTLEGISPMKKLRVAACQILTYPDPEESAAKVIKWLREAKHERAEVVSFPEACLCGYQCDSSYWKKANPARFKAAEDRVLRAARQYRLALVLGTAHWEEGRLHNSLLVADRDGAVRGRYSKIFLAEKWPIPGQRIPVWKLAGVPSCFIICADVRFPELVRLPTMAGAQVCYFCSNESGLLSEHKLSAYRAMPIARATENGIYLVMANAPGNPNAIDSPSQSHGNSKIVHPNGNVLTEAGFFEERLVVETLDLKAADRWVARRAVKDSRLVSPWLRSGLELVDKFQP